MDEETMSDVSPDPEQARPPKCKRLEEARLWRVRRSYGQIPCHRKSFHRHLPLRALRQSSRKPSSSFCKW